MSATIEFPCGERTRVSRGQPIGGIQRGQRLSRCTRIGTVSSVGVVVVENVMMMMVVVVGIMAMIDLAIRRMQVLVSMLVRRHALKSERNMAGTIYFTVGFAVTVTFAFSDTITFPVIGMISIAVTQDISRTIVLVS